MSTEETVQRPWKAARHATRGMERQDSGILGHQGAWPAGTSVCTPGVQNRQALSFQFDSPSLWHSVIATRENENKLPPINFGCCVFIFFQCKVFSIFPRDFVNP